MGGFLGFDSNTSESTTNVTATNQLQGAGDNSLLLRQIQGNVTLSSTDPEVARAMAGLSRDVALGGLTQGKEIGLGSLALVGGYGELMGDVIRNQAASNTDLAGLQSNVMLGAMAQNRQLFESTVDRLGALSETQLTGGASNLQKYLLYGLGALLVSLYFLQKR